MNATTVFLGIIAAVVGLNAEAKVISLCDRHPAVQSAVVERFRHSHPGIHCGNVTTEELESLTDFSVDFYFPLMPVKLRPADLEGMPNLTQLHFAQRGETLKLEPHFFAALPKLTYLHVENNALALDVNEDTFAGLPELKTINLFGEIVDLPARLLKGMPKLQDVSLSVRQPFPKDFFQGMPDLEVMWLYSGVNDIRPFLPDGVFAGLTNMKRLTLYAYLARETSAALLRDMAKLDTLYAPGHPDAAGEPLGLNRSYRLQAFSNQEATCEASVAGADAAFETRLAGAVRFCGLTGGTATHGKATYRPHCQLNEENRKLSTAKGAEFLCKR